jgi:hypothetical protein
MVILVVFLCLIVAAVVYAVLAQTGVIPGPVQQSRPGGRDEFRLQAHAGRAPSMAPSLARALRLRELPQGCLISLLVAGAVWFLLWGIVLILALRFLRSPYVS